MSASDLQPSSDDIIKELLSSFSKSEPATQPAAQAPPLSVAAPRPPPVATVEKKGKRMGAIKIAPLKDCSVLREAVQNCALGASANSRPALGGGADDQGHGDKITVQGPAPAPLTDNTGTECVFGPSPREDGDNQHDKSKKKKSKKSKHEKKSSKIFPSVANFQDLEKPCGPEGPKAACQEAPAVMQGVGSDVITVSSTPSSEGAPPPVPNESKNGEEGKSKKRPHEDRTSDQSSKSQSSKRKKSRSSRSPEKRKSRSSRSPEKRKSRSSRSPEKRKSRSSRSPEKSKKLRGSKSPHKQKNSRSSRSLSRHRKSRSSRSPDHKSRSGSRERRSSHSSKSSEVQEKSKSSKSERRKKSRSSRDRRKSRSRSRHRKSRSSRSRSKHKRSRSSRSLSRRKRSRSRSRSRRKRSRSRSGSRRKRSRSSRSESRRKRSRSSRSPDSHRKSSRRKSPRRKKRDSEDGSDCVKILKDKVTRKRLLEIARRNAMQLVSSGVIPSSLGAVQPVGSGSSAASSGPRSVQDLTAFCKQLAESADYSEDEGGSGLVGSDGEEEVLDLDNRENTFTYPSKHPFSLKDRPIMMNIRNAPMLPVKTNAERLQEGAKLREQFPVSSGSQHKQKDEEWTPVEPEQKDDQQKPQPPDKDQQPAVSKPSTESSDSTVFPSVDEEIVNLNLSEMVSERLRAMRNLQDNPNDSTAKQKLDDLQQTMSKWALSKQEPGKFTGSTGVKVLSPQELSAGQQAWAKKEQLKCAKPVSSAFGMRMLQKMGWSPGEGLGKNKEGSLVPLQLDVKMDKKGFHAQEELTPVKPSIPMTKSLSGKHPVSALVEHCLKCKWQPPQFQVVHDSGPDHKKSYLMKAIVNNKEYRASHTAPTKKLAKATAAAACLMALGVVSDQQLSSQGDMMCLSPGHTMQHAVGSGASQDAFPPPLSSLNLHGMNVSHHQYPQQQQHMAGASSISYSVGTGGGGIQPLMSINACDYSGRNGNVNIIIGPQIPPTHSFGFAVPNGKRGKTPLLPSPATPAAPADAFPPPGVKLDPFPPPGRVTLLPTPGTVKHPETGRKTLLMKPDAP